MNRKLECIMLVDDNADDNFIHQRAINQQYAEVDVITKMTGEEGLAHLKAIPENKTSPPDLIFLDINMPGMNGWEFLKEYDHLEKSMQGSTIVIMLTSSDVVEDIVRAKSWPFVSDFITKPLTREKIMGIAKKFFI